MHTSLSHTHTHTPNHTTLFCEPLRRYDQLDLTTYTFLYPVSGDGEHSRESSRRDSALNVPFFK